MKLSIVIPVFNEANTVAELVEKVRALDLEKEIIIVNDGSSDGTRAALAPFESAPGIRVHHSPVNLGKGASGAAVQSMNVHLGTEEGQGL